MNTIELSVTCADFFQRAQTLRQAYRAGDMTYTQLRRELDAIAPRPVQTPRQQCRMALSWLKKARAAGKAMLWWQHGQYVAAARRSISAIASPVWRARMSRAADAIEAMASKLEGTR